MTTETLEILTTPAFAMTRVTQKHTFSSGVTVEYVGVNALLSATIEQGLRAQRPAPKPSVQMVDMGNGPVAQENPHDPAYLAAMDRYESDIYNATYLKYMDACLELGVVSVDIDDDALAATKRTMALIGTPLDEISDKVAYLKYVAAPHRDELGELLKRINTRSQPSEEAVQRHAATFQGDVQGEATR